MTEHKVGEIAASRPAGQPGLGLMVAAGASLAVLAFVGRKLVAPAQPLITEPEVTRSLTIERDAEALHGAWRDPQTLSRIFGFLAEISAIDAMRTEWRVPGALGERRWTMRIVEDQRNQVLRSMAEGPGALVTEMEVRFRPASGRQGTVVSLRARFDPPAGLLGDAAAQLFGGLVPREMASKALHYFKSLVLTGEVPTTARQPAFRADPR